MLSRLLLIAAAASSTLFSSHDVVSFQLKAPFNELFDRGRADEEFSVAGTLSYTDGGQPVIVDGVQISLRGNTSKRETECTFPKLKVQFPRGHQSTPLFAGLNAIKIDTHCGEAPEDGVTVKFGRLPNEQSPLREASVYRLLETLGVPPLWIQPEKRTRDVISTASTRRSSQRPRSIGLW